MNRRTIYPTHLRIRLGVISVALAGAVVGCGGSSATLPPAVTDTDAAADGGALETTDASMDSTLSANGDSSTADDAPMEEAGEDGSAQDASGDGGNPTDAASDAGASDSAQGSDADAGGAMTDGGGDAAATTPYSVGGTVTGLVGMGLVLQDNGGDNLTVAASGAFVFPSAVADGSAYSVSVLTQPTSPAQSCVVSASSGTVHGANVTNVAVTCTTSSFTVGGTVSALSGTVVLVDNGGDALTLSANGPFAFATPIGSGATYAVSVMTQPGGQTCSVAGGSGTIGSGNITSVAVNCSGNTYSIGGTVSGLTGTLVLVDNGDNLTINANGSFAFDTPIANQTSYSVSVATQPAGETCSVMNGSGTVNGASVSGVAVSCIANLFTVGGTITGLGSGASVSLQDNGGDTLTQTSNGAFTFSAPLATGASFNVAVSAQPTGQFCRVAGGSGTVGNGNVTSAVINCASNAFTVGGTVSGLVGSVVLQDNGGDNLTLDANGSYAFATTLPTNATYNVTVLTQPPNETCTVGNATGTVGFRPVSNISVSCAGSLHSIGGTLSGLSTGTSITLQDNGGNDLTLSGDGAFTFTQKLAYGAAFDITVLVPPVSETCIVSGGAGAVTGDVTNITVTCTPKLYSIGGYLNGLAGGASITLQDNGADNLTLTSGGAFSFGTTLPYGAGYDVTVQTLPQGQTCDVTNGMGTVGFGNVSNVIVHCH
jgi:hypothetical protein